MFLPQMSPMWWTTLMLMFIISFIMCMSIMYFTWSYNMKSKKNIKLNKINWTW